MRIVTQRTTGGPEVLEIGRAPVPEPLPTEIRVRVAAAGVNPVDWKTRAGGGMAKVIGPPPFTVGWDVAGTVDAVGVGVTRFAVGDIGVRHAVVPARGGRLRRVRHRTLAALRAPPRRAVGGRGGRAAARRA